MANDSPHDGDYNHKTKNAGIEVFGMTWKEAAISYDGTNIIWECVAMPKLLVVRYKGKFEFINI